jgi:hypothetical protein
LWWFPKKLQIVNSNVPTLATTLKGVYFVSLENGVKRKTRSQISSPPTSHLDVREVVVVDVENTMSSSSSPLKTLMLER